MPRAGGTGRAVGRHDKDLDAHLREEKAEVELELEREKVSKALAQVQQRWQVTEVKVHCHHVCLSARAKSVHTSGKLHKSYLLQRQSADGP